MACRNVLLALLLPAALPSSGLPQSLLPGFQKTAQFDEQIRWDRLGSGVRVLVNAPATLNVRRRMLIVYATPNGNSLECTLGCATSEEIDWRFDIQHVAAQTRRFRELDATQEVFLAVVQAPKLSWPTFRRDQSGADRIIRELVASLAKECAASRVVLACHSGGGSFVWGYLNAVDSIPASIERIILLDANYSYSDENCHGDKLLAWVHGDPFRHLVVVAYDDREIVLNGKKVVGQDGGTFRASERMLARFRRDVEVVEGDHGPFRHVSNGRGQIQFLIHPNPENKILHTALVGEMNGLLHGLTLGTKHEEKWGRFGGPRAYTTWIQSRPFVESAQTPPDIGLVQLELPERPSDAPTGSEFRDRISDLSLDQREAAVVREITRGNVPGFLRRLRPIQVAATDQTGPCHEGVCFVTSDYLAVGSDDDFFRLPITPKAAIAIADSLDCSLLTAKISDTVHAAADTKLQPRPLTKDRQAVATFFQHHRLIEEELTGRPHGVFVAGIKKDIVLTNRLRENPHKVAIYGWHYPNGQPIQPLYVGHWDRYVDYSHGVRLLAGKMIVEGRTMKVSDVLKDKQLCGLLSNEGPIDTADVRKAAGWKR